MARPANIYIWGPPTCEYRPISGSFQAVRRLSDRSLSSMDRPNHQRSMVFRCEAARKEYDTRRVVFGVLQIFQDFATRRSETRGGDQGSSWEGGGSARLQRGAQRRPASRRFPRPVRERPKDPKSDVPRLRLRCVPFVHRSKSQYDSLGKSYFKNNSRSF